MLLCATASVAAAAICQGGPCDPAGEECDWRLKGCVWEGVLDQGDNDTCAAITAFEVLTNRLGILVRPGEELQVLSIQMMLECFHGGQPEDERKTTNYFSQMESLNGAPPAKSPLLLESDYGRPYEGGHIFDCLPVGTKTAPYRVSESYLNAKENFNRLTSLVNEFGSVSVGVCITKRLREYESPDGVICPIYVPNARDVRCEAHEVHNMPVVGFSKSRQTLLLKNSWSLGWGCDGYIEYGVQNLPDLVEAEEERREEIDDTDPVIHLFAKVAFVNLVANG